MTTPTHKVRIVFTGAGIVHALTSSEPDIRTQPDGSWDVRSFDVIPGTTKGDTIAAIRWEQVAAVTYRPIEAPGSGDPGRPPETSVRDVVRALREQPGHAVPSKRRLGAVLGRSHGAIDRVIELAVAQGLIEEVPSTRGAIGYRLVGDL